MSQGKVFLFMKKIYHCRLNFGAYNKNRINMSISIEEFELTANSLGAQTETLRKHILRTLICRTVNSQDDSRVSLL